MYLLLLLYERNTTRGPQTGEKKTTWVCPATCNDYNKGVQLGMQNGGYKMGIWGMRVYGTRNVRDAECGVCAK